MSPLPDPGDVARPWCDAYPPGVPPTYDLPAVPLTRFLDDAARDFPVATALRFRGRGWRWSDLRDLVDRAAAQMADLGVRQGDRVVLVSPNTPAAVVASFATWRLGAVLVPLDPTLPTGALEERLLSVEPTIVVVDLVALDAVSAVRHQLPGLRHVVVTDPLRWVGMRDRIAAPLRARTMRRRAVSRDDDVLTFDRLLLGGPALVRQAAVTPSSAAAIVFTGGTTGDARGVVLSHGNLVANAFQNRLWVPDVRSGHEVVLAALPLWHVYGLTSVLLTGALAGATIVLVARPDASTLLDAIEQERPTLFPGVPRMYQSIVDDPTASRRDLSSLRVAVSGGAPLEASTIAAFERVAGGVRLRQGYGLSETSPLTHACPVYGAVDPGAVGLPVTATLAIVRRLDSDERADTHEVGELLVHGPQVMAGYWRGPDLAPESPGPWFATGDLATVDATGVFRVLGRIADVPRRDGRRVVPAAVESALLAHPAVARAAMLGVPVDGDREELVAVVVPHRRGRVTPPELEAHLEQTVDEADRPDRIVLRGDLPTSALGKVLRRTLRTELAADAAAARRDEVPT